MREVYELEGVLIVFEADFYETPEVIIDGESVAAFVASKVMPDKYNKRYRLTLEELDD